MNQQTSITCGHHITPSQLAAHEAARARAMRKIEAARRNAKANKPALAIAAPEPAKIEEPKPLIPPFFKTYFARQVVWEGEYCPYAGGSKELIRERSMREIALSVLEQYPTVTLEDIRGVSRTKHIAWARHHVVYAIKTERPAFSFPQIGRFLGNRDHTTLLNSFSRFKELLDANVVSN